MSQQTKKWSLAELEKLAIYKQQGLTWEQITEHFPGESANALRKTYYRFMRKEHLKEEKSAPKVLVFDIETSPMEAYVWGLFDQTVGLEQIIKDWSVLSFSAKWLGDDASKTMYKDTRDEKDPRNDKELIKIIHSLLDEADIVVVQNGVKFDIPKLNARFVMHGLPPVSSFRVIDTYKIARARFGFTSNKLAYMTDKLCTKYKKLNHAEFSGFSLWKECLAGNLKAWKEMEKYNKYDVLSLEELYFKLAPWDKSINFSVYSDEAKNRCSCGNDKFVKKGFIYSNAGKYERHVCTSCKKEFKNSTNELSKEKRKSMTRV